MDRYIGGEDIDRKLLVDDLERAVARGVVLPGHPGLLARPASAAPSCWTSSSRGFPSPLEHPMPEVFTPAGKAGPAPSPATPPGPLVAEVVKTTSDPYVGRVSLVRVFSGTAAPRRTVHVSGHFSSFFGDEHRPRGPRRGRAHRRAVAPRSASKQRPADRGGRRRPRRDRPAEPGRDRRHPVRPATSRWC